jgi:hypothetical protein
VLAVLAPLPVQAVGTTSVYTDFDVQRCRKLPQPKDDPVAQGAWLCRGHRGMPVRLEVADERMLVSFGKIGDGDPVSSQTFPAFNDVYSGRVEWRLRAGKAFATILRWNVMTAGDGGKATGPVKPSGRVLVVTRLGPGGSCHVGYVDAVANPDANALARAIADEKAQEFKCGTDKPEVRGKRTPGLAFPER